MTLTIELSREQEQALEKVASTFGVDLHEFARLRLLETIQIKKKTTAEVLTGWDASGEASVYARNPEDATKIALQLRTAADNRDILL